MYHLMVLLRHKGVSLADVETELARRFGVSGTEEKASRKK
jgi:phosphoribosyl-ATP pyrophosphohydrolase